MNEEDIYKLSTYNYSLPKELIAQFPARNRDESRLLHYDRSKNKITHHIFKELPDLLTKNDVLVLNDTKVIPARFYAKTDDKKEVEILLVKPTNPANLTWKVLAKPLKYLSKTKTLTINTPMYEAGSTKYEESHTSYLPPQRGEARSTLLSGMPPTSSIIIEVINEDTIDFKHPENLEFVLKYAGRMPLPPYIKRDKKQEARGRKDDDFQRYQTVFAKHKGAVAAPTAALHFTNNLLEKIISKGIEVYYVTLHVGPGTFLPVRTEDIREHKLIPEDYFIEKETWEKIINAKKSGKKIIACGTTTVRALEYAALINKCSGLTSLFITPEFKFSIVDSLITNFHLPKTTLLILLSTLIGWDKVQDIYNEAIEKRYMFYSYGDAMFVR